MILTYRKLILINTITSGTLTLAITPSLLSKMRVRLDPALGDS